MRSPTYIKHVTETLSAVPNGKGACEPFTATCGTGSTGETFDLVSAHTHGCALDALDSIRVRGGDAVRNIDTCTTARGAFLEVAIAA